MTVPVRDAATVMLVRDGSDGVEVFLLRRTPRAVFSPGAHVFPGGAVDDADALVPGVDRFVVAAIRECFEEAGALLARHRDGRRVDTSRLAPLRRAVHAGELTMVELCERESLVLDADALVPFGRWVTPPRAPRRFDTRFFVARAPEEQAFVHDDRELVDSAWFRPADALARFERGEIDLILPTQRSLEALAAATSVDELVA